MHRSASGCIATLLLGLAATTGTYANAGGASWTSSWLGKGTFINIYGAIGFQQESSCPSNKYVVGLEIRSGMLIDAMRVECATLGPSGEHQNISQGAFVGKEMGGSVRLMRCPSGKVVTAARARAGEFIDQVSFACRSWNATQGLHGSLAWQSPHGGSGGEPVGPVECPSGLAMTRLKAKASGSYIGMFSISCESLPPTQPATTMTAQSALSPTGRAASSSPTSRPASIAQGVQPATQVPTPTAPVLRTLTRKPTAGGGAAEIMIDGEHFAANQITRVEIAGTAVTYRVISPTRIAATVPQHVVHKLNNQAVPIVITSGGQRISKQLPLR